jgi:hypothetical protein
MNYNKKIFFFFFRLIDNHTIDYLTNQNIQQNDAFLQNGIFILNQLVN